MSELKVLLENSVDDVEKSRIIGAIQQLKGVKTVQSQTTETEPYTGGRIKAVIEEDTRIPPRPATRQQEPVTQPPEDRESQQVFFNEVITWAVKNHMLQMSDVQSWSPEEIVSHAFKLFEKMPEDAQKAIGQKISSMNT